MEREFSANDSENAMSDWSYLDPSTPTTEQRIDDVFMGTEQDHMSTYDDARDNYPLQEGSVGLSSTVYTDSAFLFSDPVFDMEMSAAWDSDRDHSVFHDEMWTSGADASGDVRLPSSGPHHLGTYPTSSGPWNPVGSPRIMGYDAGYVAYVDSPNSSSSQSSDDPPSETEISPQGSVVHASQDAKHQDLPLESPSLANQQQFRWEVTGTTTHGQPRVCKLTITETLRVQRKGRQGPLGSQKAKEAHAVRRLRACWPCKVSKMKVSSFQMASWDKASADDKAQCSIGSPCNRCSDHQLSFSHLTYRICSRSGFADYAALYFPGMLSPSWHHESTWANQCRRADITPH
jgi:hypothetical protein